MNEDKIREAAPQLYAACLGIRDSLMGIRKLQDVIPLLEAAIKKAEEK